MRPAPYQILFPLGILAALMGVGVWLTQDFFTTHTILTHSRLIAGGFLWSFIAGFLMTALPRMSLTKEANFLELFTATAIIVFQMIVSWALDGRWFYGAQILLISFIIIYAVRRLIQAKKSVPIFFSHIGIGMSIALMGAIYHFQGNSFMGIHLYHIGAVLLLVLGIGTRFFSFLSGLPSIFENNSSALARRAFHAMGALAALLLFLAGSGFSLAYLGLAGLMLLYLFFIWQVQRAAPRPSALKHGMRLVALMLPLSFILTWIYPVYYIAWFHLIFIGCFGLIILSVATRVTLAHGAYSVDIEMKSRALWCFVFFLTLSLIFRIIYALANTERALLLHIAVCFWILGLISWCFSFFMRILKSGAEPKHAR